MRLTDEIKIKAGGPGSGRHEVYGPNSKFSHNGEDYQRLPTGALRHPANSNPKMHDIMKKAGYSYRGTNTAGPETFQHLYENAKQAVTFHTPQKPSIVDSNY